MPIGIFIGIIGIIGIFIYIQNISRNVHDQSHVIFFVDVNNLASKQALLSMFMLCATLSSYSRMLCMCHIILDHTQTHVRKNMERQSVKCSVFLRKGGSHQCGCLVFKISKGGKKKSEPPPPKPPLLGMFFGDEIEIYK